MRSVNDISIVELDEEFYSPIASRKKFTRINRFEQPRDYDEYLAMSGNRRSSDGDQNKDNKIPYDRQMHTVP